MNEIVLQEYYIPISSAVLGCAVFIVLKISPESQSLKHIILDLFALIFSSVFCGIGAYLLALGYLSKPDDSLIAAAVIPFASGFFMPSFLRGLTTILQTFWRDPFAVVKMLIDTWNSKK